MKISQAGETYNSEVQTTYDVNGKATVFTGKGADGNWFTKDDVSANWSGVGNPYQYTGQRYDPETELMYYKNRYFDTDLGRFIHRDPIGYEDGVNLYEYVGSMPIISVDPEGLGPNLIEQRRRRDRSRARKRYTLCAIILCKCCGEKEWRRVKVYCYKSRNRGSGAPWSGYSTTFGENVIHTGPNMMNRLREGDEVAERHFAHECGHTCQAKELGPFYLPLVGSTTLFGRRSPWERRADDEGVFGGFDKPFSMNQLREAAQDWLSSPLPF